VGLVNDDGTFTSYGEQENLYLIPKEELKEKEVFRAPKKKREFKKRK